MEKWFKRIRYSLKRGTISKSESGVLQVSGILRSGADGEVIPRDNITRGCDLGCGDGEAGQRGGDRRIRHAQAVHHQVPEHYQDYVACYQSPHSERRVYVFSIGDRSGCTLYPYDAEKYGRAQVRQMVANL